MSSLALRICKADIAVGLDEVEDERLRAMMNIIEGGGEADEGKKGAWSEKWAGI